MFFLYWEMYIFPLPQPGAANNVRETISVCEIVPIIIYSKTSPLNGALQVIFVHAQE